MTKTAITALVFALFLATTIAYLYCEKYIPMQENTLRSWYALNNAYAVISLWMIQSSGVNTFLQESLINGQKLLLVLLWLDVVLTNFGFIRDPYTNLIIFCAGAFAAVAVLIYEFFKPKSWKITLAAVGSAIYWSLYAAHAGCIT